jgi:hypothetical protein
MLWWIFIPASYFAVAVDLACADLVAWRGSSVAFLVLLWSFVAMRSDSRKVLMQAGILGVLRDLSMGLPLGGSSVILMVIVWMIGLMPLPPNRDHRSWVLWGLPLLVSGLAALHVLEWYQAGMQLGPGLLIAGTLREAALTAVFGLFCVVLFIAFRRLVMPRSFSSQSTLETSSFFLSR